MTIRTTTLLLAWTACQGLCQSAGSQTVPTDATELNAEYGRLSQTIYNRHEDPESVRLHTSDPERVALIEARMQGILRETATRILESEDPRESRIADALRAIQGELWFRDPTMTNSPFAHLFVVNGLRCAAVGYIILEGGDGIPDSKAFLDFYVKQNAGWVRHATTGADFKGTTFFASPIAAGLSGQAWFVAWGMKVGDTGARVGIRLYSFDGDQVRVAWKRDGLIRGEVGVSANSVTLDYDKEYRPLENVERVHEVLHVVPGGLD